MPLIDPDLACASDRAEYHRGEVERPAAYLTMQCAIKLRGVAVSTPAAQPRSRARRPLAVRAVAAEPATQRLTKDDLVKYVASGCKPRDQWRCGGGGEREVWAAAAAEPASTLASAHLPLFDASCGVLAFRS